MFPGWPRRAAKHSCFPVLKHLDRLPIYYLFKKLYYFQGTTLCILAETKLSIRTQHLREHVRSSSRHLENRRYKLLCSCLNYLTLLMSRTIFSTSSLFSCWKVLIQLFMSLLDEVSPGRPFTTSEYFLADIVKKKGNLDYPNEFLSSFS